MHPKEPLHKSDLVMLWKTQFQPILPKTLNE